MAQWVNINVIRQATTSQLCWDRIDSIAYCRLPIHDLWIGSQQRPRSKRRPWLEVNNAAAPLPRFWEQSLHGLQPAGWLWSLFCGNSLRRGRSDADDFIQPDTPWRLARENGSDATIVWNVWSAIALKLILKSQKMSFYEKFVAFCSWLLHRSDKGLRISSWKGTLQILQGGKNFPQLDSAIQSLMLTAQVARNGELPLQAAHNNCLCDVNQDHSLPMIALPPSDWTRAENMCILFICKIFIGPRSDHSLLMSLTN